MDEIAVTPAVTLIDNEIVRVEGVIAKAESLIEAAKVALGSLYLDREAVMPAPAEPAA